ncbi:MAG TPA: hypothetical protein VMP11_14355 [Verrucomicrobiae bacterium]|nr:hypothetical protein [Verrucomicrobiae bacterium]
MTITRKTVADKIGAYLHHRLSLASLVDWAENAMMSADFSAQSHQCLRDVVARLGVADVRAFGLTWEDCEQFLESLGYSARIEIVAGRTARSAATVQWAPLARGRSPSKAIRFVVAALL